MVKSDGHNLEAVNKEDVVRLPLDDSPLYFQNLPVFLTPLIGREDDLQVVGARLLRPQVRLLTLTGLPGVGKTRLAVELATRMLETFAQGICFVSLAHISDPQLVVPTIGHTLGQHEDGMRPLFECIKTFLHEKQFLLLLDNFEQVVPAAPQLMELISACPQLKLVVTSRAALNVRGEYEFAVPPLAIPDMQSQPSYDALSRVAAIELFVQHVEALKPSFHLTESNAVPIARICTHLGGMPLPIEMAAAGCKLFSPEALLTRIEQGLEALSAKRQDAPGRQQDMRSTLNWSYDLLTFEEQALFRQLCIFVKDFTLEAADAISTNPGGFPTSILEGIGSLIDKSLLQQREEERREPRFYFLEIMRGYGLERLAECGELEGCRDAHAAYYLALSEQAEIALSGALQGAWLERLEQEHENLQAALQWLLERHKFEGVMRIAAALHVYWFLSGRLSEGRAFLEQVLEAASEDETQSGSRARARALSVAGSLAMRMHDPLQAIVSLEAGLALFRRLQDQVGITASLQWLGTARHMLGEFEKGIANEEEALRLFLETGDTNNCAEVLLTLGIGAFARGEYGQARKLIEESLALTKAGEVTWVRATDLHYLGYVSYAQGDYTYGCQMSQESLTLFRTLHTPLYVPEVMTILAYGLAALGEQASAQAWLEKALLLAREGESIEDIVHALCGLGYLALQQDHLAEAQALFEESVAKMQGRWLVPRNKWLIASCLEGLAGIAQAQEQPSRAVQLLAVAHRVRMAYGYYTAFGTEQPFFDRTLTEARTKLGEKNFAAAWTTGQAMTPQQVAVIETAKTFPVEVSVIPSVTPQPDPAPDIPDELTTREVEVLRLLALGMTNNQIAEKLVVSTNTVNAHIQSIYRKIDVTSRSAATRFAMEHRLV